MAFIFGLGFSIMESVSFREALGVWFRIGLLSFGGPAGQIALMHRVLVEERRWVSEERFLHALSYCMLLPGPEAQQLATYVGWLLHGWRGGLTAGVLFILPGFVSILGLSLLYAYFQNFAFVPALLWGLKAATMALVAEAAMRLGKKALKSRLAGLIAIASFVAIGLFKVPFPLIILSAGLLGILIGRTNPELLLGAAQPRTKTLIDDAEDRRASPGWRRSLAVAASGLILWFAPILALQMWLGPEHILVQEGFFFSKAAVLTFGGAYSVLAYMAQQAVEVYGWLGPGEMLDGLGMAETTPGPLIQVVQFVGFMGAWRHPEPFSPLTGALIGSVLTTWVTFVPCFLWIFLGAPYIETLRGSRPLSAALAGITAAVLGTLLNLALWFSLNVSFTQQRVVQFWGMDWKIPDLSSFQAAPVLIAAAAFIALARYKASLPLTLLVATLSGALWAALRL